jgi:hypothetical protein
LKRFNLLASFNVHLSVGLVSSGIAATSAMVGGLASEKQVVLYFVLGTIGSLLPDIDADKSTPLQIAFSFFSVLLAFVVMFTYSAAFPSVMELVLIWLCTYLFFRWIIFALFTCLTTHRGIFHSVPAALFFGFFTAALSYQLFLSNPLQAWMSGMFISFGYLVHLLLDELYSVNVFGIKTRKSLGTALKLYYKNSAPATMSMYLAMIAAFLATPSLTPVTQQIIDEKVFHKIHQRLIPEGTWLRYSPPKAVLLSDHTKG